MRWISVRCQLVAAVGSCLSLLSASATPEAGPQWRKFRESNGVIVFERTEEQLDLLSIRAESVIRASSSHIIEVMKDNSRANKWMPYVAEKRDIRPSGPDSRIEYTHVDMPWPMRDRYFINRGRISDSGADGIVIEVESVEEVGFAEPDKVRGWIHFSNFTLIPISDNATRMTLEVNVDPRGLIPDWIVNIAQKQWPGEFFAGLNGELAFRGFLRTDSENVRDGSQPVAH